MRVESEPPGAWVIDESDSEILGKTPWQRQSDARAGQLALTLRLVGHREKSVVLNLDRDDHAYVALTAKTADSATKSKAGASAKPAKKPVLKRIAAPIKKLAGKIADKFRKKPASGSKSR